MLDGGILARCVHCLEDDQQAPMALRRKDVLQTAQFLNSVRKQLLGQRLNLGFKTVGVGGIVILETEMFPLLDAVVTKKFFDFHRSVQAQQSLVGFYS